MLFQKRYFSVLCNWCWKQCLLELIAQPQAPQSLSGPWKEWCMNDRRVSPSIGIGGARNNDIFSLRLCPFILSQVESFPCFQSQTMGPENANSLYNSKHVLGKIEGILYSLPCGLSVQLCFSFWFVSVLMELLFICKSVNIFCFHCILRYRK